MKLIFGLLLAALAADVAAARSQAHPVVKATELLEKLWQKGREELNEEALRFQKLKQWCGDKEESKKKEIAEGEEKEERLAAAAERAGTVTMALQKDIESLAAKLAKLDEERARADERRSDEASTYATSDKELSKSIRAVQRASNFLRERGDAQSKAAAVSELQTLPKGATAALQVADSAEASEGILAMLQKLADGFRGELEGLRSGEMHAKQEHELMLHQLTLQKEAAEASLRSKRSALGAAQSEEAEATGDHREAVKDIEEDKKYLEDLQVMCSTKAETFEKRRGSRQAELKGLSTALSLLRDKVSGLIQLSRRGSALAALRSGEVHRAFQALRRAGMEELATRLAGEPLKKVRQMIGEMISRLEEVAREAHEKQAFCDAELAASRAAETAAKDAAVELQTEIEDLAAEVDQLTEDEAALRAALKELRQEAAEAQAERAAAKETNAANIQEAKASQEALEAALVALREVYGQAPASLLEVGQNYAVTAPLSDAPDSFPDADYVASPQKGVLELLEVASSSFAASAAELADEEKAEEGQFKQFLQESKEDEARKSRELEHTEERLRRRQLTGKESQAELAESRKKLEKVQGYLEKLEDQCKMPVVTPEERRQKREEEIGALKEALSALEEVPS